MEEGEEVVVVYEYTAALPDELSLKVGDVITRVERLEGGWWRGELNKVRGMFPDNFVKVRQKKCVKWISKPESIGPSPRPVISPRLRVTVTVTSA